MKKLKLNKKTISALDTVEMGKVQGGVKYVVFTMSVRSCDRGSAMGKTCCFKEFTQ